jgi:Cu+-exporting ATPase
VKDAAALERAHHLNVLVLDKTGTLTEGILALTDVLPSSASNVTQLLTIAASLSQHSNHPLSIALTTHAHTQGITLDAVDNFNELAGNGLNGIVSGKTYQLGSPVFIAKSANITLDELALLALQRQGKSIIAVAQGDVLLGLIAFGDTLRQNSKLAVSKLREMGIRVVMLSGDNTATAFAIAQQAGIDEYHAEVLPQDKAKHVASYKSKGGMVGMVGDGINDAPALAAADVSFAMKSGSDIAIEAADITLMHNDLMSVVSAIDLSRVTISKIRQNLFFAFAYNVLGIPLAAIGLLNPVIAGGAMAMSSVSVISNALLLKNWTAEKIDRR